MSARVCNWCGHLTHARECPAQIHTGTARKQETRPCPCIKRSPQAHK